MEERPPIWKVTANILNKQSRTADKVWPSSLGVGRGANQLTPHWTWTVPLVQHKHKKRNMRFDTWNFRTLYTTWKI